MIAKWLTRIYVMFACLMLFGLTGLLLESLTVSLLPFLALLLCGYVGLFTLWWMGNLHQRVLTEQVIKESSDRKSTRLNSSHVRISYAVFCLKKKKKKKIL